MDVSYSHGGKGSPFDVRCRRCISVNNPLCYTLLDDHTWQMVRRVANISCVMVGCHGYPFWCSLPTVFVQDGLCLYIHLLSNVVINVFWLKLYVYAYPCHALMGPCSMMNFYVRGVATPD